MKFVLVNGRTPRAPACCALCCEVIAEGYVRDIATGLSYCNHRCWVDRRTAFLRVRQDRARAS
jgi:hypothetical protein